MKNEETLEFGLGKSILFSLILITLTLTGAELAVRGWARYLRDPYQRFDPVSQTFTLVPGEHRTRDAHVVVNSDGFVGPELQADGPDLWRIVALGDSCTFSSGNGVGTYVAMTQAWLAQNAPSGVRPEIVNAGIEGLSSDLALRRLRAKVLPLHPNVVTIYLGWNDLMKYDPLSQDARAGTSRAARYLDEIWLIRGMRKLLFFYVRPRLFPPQTGSASFTGRFSSFHPTYFEASLGTIVDEVRQAGADPILFTLPTVVRASMSAEDLRAANVVFPYFSTGYGVGDLLDLVGTYNETIRNLARERSVPLVELASEFEALADVRPYFYDTMHTTKDGQAFIASLLEQTLVREGLIGPSPR